MEILVIGGTRFFGRRLVSRLLEEGHDVTILTRGQTRDPFGHHVRRLCALRSDREQMTSAIGSSRFDVVYDQICSSPDDAKLACELFSGRTARYIFISSIYVYPPGVRLVEGDYDPLAHPLRMGTRDTLGYEDGKRYAEGVFLRAGQLPTTCIRFPIVMGYDDYTGRFAFHIARILTDTPILIPLPSGRMNYIGADLAASFLSWVKDVPHFGPINAACTEALSADDLVAMTSQILGRPARVIRQGLSPPLPSSPYHRPDDMVMEISLATRLGFSFPSLHSWFADEVEKAAALVGP